MSALDVNNPEKCSLQCNFVNFSSELSGHWQSMEQSFVNKFRVSNRVPLGGDDIFHHLLEYGLNQHDLDDSFLDIFELDDDNNQVNNQQLDVNGAHENNALSAEYSNASPAEYSNASSAEYSNASPAEYSYTSPVGYSNTSPVEYSNASPVEYSNVSPVEYSNTSPVEYSNALPVEYSNALPVEYSNVSPAESSSASPAESCSTSPAEYCNASPAVYSNSYPADYNNKSPAYSKKVLDINENYLNNNDISASSSLEQDSPRSECQEEPQETESAYSLPIKAYSKSVEKSKPAKKKPRKKACEVTRTVITETIFNGSIADIVKTRKRGAQSISKEQEFAIAEFNVDRKLSHAEPKDKEPPFYSTLACSYQTKSEDEILSQVPKIKLCLKPKEPVVDKNSKSSKQAEKKASSRTHVAKKSSKSRTSKKSKKQKDKKKSDIPTLMPTSPAHSLNSEANNINDSILPETFPKVVANIKTSPIKEYKITKKSISDTMLPSEPSAIQDEVQDETVLKEVVTAPRPVKRKLRGIEEYKAHKAKFKKLEDKKPSGDSSSLVPALSTLPEIDQEGTSNHSQTHLDSVAPFAPESFKCLPPIGELNLTNYAHQMIESNINPQVPKDSFLEFNAEGCDQSLPTEECKETLDKLPTQTPLIATIDAIAKCEVNITCAKTSSEDSPIKNQLVGHSASHVIAKNASPDIPLKTKKMETLIPYIIVPLNFYSSTCDKETEAQKHLDEDVPPAPSADCAESLVGNPGTSSECSTDADKSQSMPTRSFSPASPNNKSRRQYRRRYTSSSSEDDSQLESSYQSSRRSSTRNSRHRSSNHREKRSRSRSSCYSSFKSSSRYRRSRSFSRGRSYSRDSSCSSSESIYQAYRPSNWKMVQHRPSTSPIYKSEKPSRYEKRSPWRSKRTLRHSSRSSRYRTSSEHSNYSPSPTRRRHRKSRRNYSESSNSRSRSRCRYSRSRSRSSYERYQSSRSSYSSRQRSNWREEKQKQCDERRVVYVGVIPDGYTQSELRERFSSFGYIEHVRIHTRNSRRNDNFGFVTFRDKQDAYQAVEHGNDHPFEPKFGISFGGRRSYCKQPYSDFDKENEMRESYDMPLKSHQDESFDHLLQGELKRVHRKKS